MAVHLNRVGLPLGITAATLKAWVANSRPADGNAITPTTIVEPQVYYA